MHRWGVVRVRVRGTIYSFDDSMISSIHSSRRAPPPERYSLHEDTLGARGVAHAGLDGTARFFGDG